jgi:DNA-binding transcriptional ArsR family regulator
MSPPVASQTLNFAAMQRHAASAAKLMRALSNRHRLLVLCVLSEGELSVGELNARVRLSQSALSQHLAVLRHEHLVTTRRSAQTIYYKVSEGVAMEIVRLLHDHYCCATPVETPDTGRSDPQRSKRTRNHKGATS